MNTRRTRLVPVRVEALCEVDGCVGTLVSTGHSYSNSFRTSHSHKCSVCRRRIELFDESYPRIEYEPLLGSVTDVWNDETAVSNHHDFSASADVVSALKASDALLERQLDDCAKRIGERIERELLGDKPRV